MEHVARWAQPRERRRARAIASLGIACVALAAVACGSPAGPTPAPTVATTAAGTAAAIPGDFPLLGTWVTEVSKADLAAAGITDPSAQNENSGRFTWTFAPDGTWTQAQESLDGSPINSPVFRGTYTVDGQILVATTEFPEQYRDDGLTYAWTLDGAAVRFDLQNPPDPVLEVIVESHPWARPS